MLCKVNIAIIRPFLCFHFVTIFISKILQCLNQILLPLFILSKVNIDIKRPFLCFHCLTKRIICLNDEAIFVSLLFRFLHSLNHIQLPLLMLSKVDIAILRPFLCFHFVTKLIIRLNDEVLFISLLFRFLNSLNHIQLRLLMLCKVNIAILLPFLCFHFVTKLIIRLNDEVLFISLLFRFLNSLNHIQLPLFMLSKVNIAI